MRQIYFAVVNVFKGSSILLIFLLYKNPYPQGFVNNFSLLILKKYSVKYNPAYILASRLGVSGYLVSRFTGSIFIGRGSKKK